MTPVIWIPALLLALWSVGLVALGHRLGWWSAALVGDTLFWFFGVAVVLLFNIDKAIRTQGYFRRTILAAVGVAVFVEVFLNLYVLSIWGELILAVVLIPITLMSAAAATRKEFSHLKAYADGCLALTGFGILGYVIFQILRNWQGFDRQGAVRELWLPVWLTLGVVPLIYLISIYAAYDGAFRLVNFSTGIKRARIRSKLALVLKLRGRVRRIGAFNMPWGKKLGEAASFSEALRVIDEFQAWERERRLAPRREREQLERFVGAQGADDDGKRLDQREFKETKDALRTLLFAQMGWHRKPGQRYREELLGMLQPQFERAGLPSEHGITLQVAENGRSWWAWRRTVTGWCLGIGAAGPPPDEWLYDGREPPSGPPSENERGWSQWGRTAKNW